MFCFVGGNGTVGRAGSAAASLLPAAGTVAGARGAAATGNGALTSAQAAAQMALCNGTGHLNGLMPVRTGLAWATLGIQSEHQVLPALNTALFMNKSACAHQTCKAPRGEVTDPALTGRQGSCSSQLLQYSTGAVGMYGDSPIAGW